MAWLSEHRADLAPSLAELAPDETAANASKLRDMADVYRSLKDYAGRVRNLTWRVEAIAVNDLLSAEEQETIREVLVDLDAARISLDGAIGLLERGPTGTDEEPDCEADEPFVVGRPIEGTVTLRFGPSGRAVVLSSYRP